jgi:hypothetical protein
MTNQIETLGDDILRGCPAIGAYIGKTGRAALFDLERGRIPAWRDGVTWCASKAALRRHYAELASRPIDPEALKAEKAKRAEARRLAGIPERTPPRRRKRQLVGEANP